MCIAIILFSVFVPDMSRSSKSADAKISIEIFYLAPYKIGLVGLYLPGLEGEGVETAGSANFIGCAETGLTGFDGLTAGADKPKRSGC